jgi:putative MATE family efflux protein
MGTDLTEGEITKTIVKTSAPMVVAFLLHSAFNIVDAFFVGKISAEALAAVSISFPVVFLIISLGTGVGVGATSVVARFIGAKEYKRADNAAEHALLAAAALGLSLSVIGYLSAPTLFDLIGAQGSLKALALDYLNILLFFAVFMMFGFVGNSLLRGEGDMTTPMKVMGAAALLNMILDPLFIFTFGLGVRGAAIATVLSRGIAVLYLAYHILSGRSWLRLDYRNFSYDFDYIRRIFTVGIPSSLSNVTMSLGMFLLTIIVGFFGTDALAAFGIGFRLDSLALLPGMGVAVAVVSIVGQSVGAGKFERARDVTLKAGLMASAFMTCIGLVFYVFAPQIVSVFNDSPQVLAYGVSFLHIIPFSYLVVGMSMCISGAFLGSGKAVYALAVTVSRMVVFSVPASYLLSHLFGVPGIWAGIVIGSFMSFILSLLIFRYCDWTDIQPNQPEITKYLKV